MGFHGSMAGPWAPDGLTAPMVAARCRKMRARVNVRVKRAAGVPGVPAQGTTPLRGVALGEHGGGAVERLAHLIQLVPPERHASRRRQQFPGRDALPGTGLDEA